MSAVGSALGGPNRKSEPSLAQIPEDVEMNDHMKAMWAGQSNVLVAVRVRPLMKHDPIKKSCIRVLDGKVVIVLDPAAGDKQDVLRANRNREKQYAFDSAFDPSTTQEQVYNTTTKFLIHGVLDGYNATVFAYGQTGSGKTHTMIGSESDPGIMVRVMEDLFIFSKSHGTQQGVHYKVTVSFLEVYNENIRDLLSDVEEYLDLREDPIKGPVVASITEIEATSGSEVMRLLHQGNAKRSQAATAANEVSSRSHAVLQVVVECRDRAPGTVANIKVGKLSLVDLAGSERAANTKNVGARLVEGANINRSLLALGNCINALGEKGNKGNFVPYRDSKLTRLLKDSLGGNCRTVMIANISSAESSFEETLNTLKYANRAKNIKTNVQRNVLNVNYHISEYVELINNLRSEIQVLKNQISTSAANVPAERVGSAGFHRGDGMVVAMENLGIAAGVNGNNGMVINTNFHNGLPPRALSPIAPNTAMGATSPFLGNRPHEPSTPFQALRESLKSGAANNENRELIYNMRQRIVDNFQERMQLRRSLIELEDQNVQNSIEVSKRQLIVVQWSEQHGDFLKKGDTTKADFTAYIMGNGSPEVMEAWQECEQLRKAIIKNNGMKKNIAKRLRHNEKEAEKFREDLSRNVTSEDRKELMALQYQVGRLELENMELEQHRIVHESILKGKDLTIQKLKLQLAVKDKIINRQQSVLKENNIDSKVGYEQLALMEETLMAMGDSENMPPPSPPRSMADILSDFGTNHTEKTNAGSTYDLSDELISTPEENAERKSHSSQRKHRKNHHRHGNHHHHNRNKLGSNNSNSKDYLSDDNNKPQVPRLKISNQNRNNNNNIEKSFSEDEHGPPADADNENDYEEIPFTEREIALTARDRDLIEQGDWSEIQSELSDQSFSLGRERGMDGKEPHRRHPRKESKDIASSNNGNNGAVDRTPADGKVLKDRENNSGAKSEVQAKLSSIKEPKGVHGPRGGRVYRSSVSTNANESTPSNTNTNSNNSAVNSSKAAGNRLNYQNNILMNNDDISDDDSINAKFQSKYRHYSSPRGDGKSSNSSNKNSNVGSYDKLEPIVKENQSEEGVFSGRKVEKDVSPRDNYAVIYPANSHKKERLITDLSEDKYLPPGNKPSNSKQPKNSSNNNQSKAVEDDNSDYFEIRDANNNKEAAAFDNGLVIKSKPIGSKPVLGKIKPRALNNNGDGALSSLPSATSLNTGDNAVNANGNNPPPAGPPLELNILGSGFEGMSGNNNNSGNNLIGNSNNNPRPSNRLNKPSVRPIKAMALKANNGSTDANENAHNSNYNNAGVDLSINGSNNSDSNNGNMQMRMRSLPALSKQASGNNMPVSARDKT